jgi:hypothetical protein
MTDLITTIVGTTIMVGIIGMGTIIIEDADTMEDTTTIMATVTTMEDVIVHRVDDTDTIETVKSMNVTIMQQSIARVVLSTGATMDMIYVQLVPTTIERTVPTDDLCG